jgi:hypothetical protein
MLEEVKHMNTILCNTYQDFQKQLRTDERESDLSHSKFMNHSSGIKLAPKKCPALPHCLKDSPDLIRDDCCTRDPSNPRNYLFIVEDFPSLKIPNLNAPIPNSKLCLVVKKGENQ